MQNKTLGQRFAESVQYKDAQRSRQLPSAPYEFKSWHETKALSTDAASAGGTVQPFRQPGITAPNDRPLTIRDLLPSVPVTSSPVEDVRETGFTNNAATVAEGALKPESDLTFDKVEVPIRVIAHHIRASRQVLSDAPMLQNHVDGRLRYGILSEEESQLLYGDGLGENLEGFLVNADRQTLAWSATPSGSTRLDVIRRAIAMVQVAEYPASGVVLNPLDAQELDLLKGIDGHYLRAPSDGGGYWNLPAVVTNAINSGEAAVGAFALCATIYDREQANVRISEHHGDVFLRNQVVLLGEERIGLSVGRPEAVVHITFDAAPAA